MTGCGLNTGLITSIRELWGFYGDMGKGESHSQYNWPDCDICVTLLSYMSLWLWTVVVPL